MTILTFLMIILIFIVLIGIVNEKFFHIQSDIALIMFSFIISLILLMVSSFLPIEPLSDFIFGLGDFGFEEYLMDDAETAIVCFGGTARAAMDAVNAARAEGKKVGLFRPITVWPFPEKQLLARLPQLKNILMVEHNHGQMLLEVQRVTHCEKPVHFLGRVDGTVISPSDILAKLNEMEGVHHAE